MAQEILMNLLNFIIHNDIDTMLYGKRMLLMRIVFDNSVENDKEI